MRYTDAPNKARKLVKRAPFVRRELNRVSNAEAKGIQGARAERERITADLARGIAATEKAIKDTRATAEDFRRAALSINTCKALEPLGPISTLAAVAARLGDVPDDLGQLCSDVAERAAEAADRAQDRIDHGEPELRSVALLAQLKALLPGVDHDIKHPSLTATKNAFHDASKLAADIRKGQSDNA